MRPFVAIVLSAAASPAFAQTHMGHGAHGGDGPAPTTCEEEAARHRAMGHAVPDGACKSAPDDMPEPSPEEGHAGRHAEHSGMDHGRNRGSINHGAMDHGAMDHEAMDHVAMDHSAMPVPRTAPPAAAGSGPARAADAIWGADAMRASRAALRTEIGGMRYFWFQGERAEYRARKGGDGYLWDVQGYYGGDLDKFWFKSEGEGSFGARPEDAEIQGLWSHAIGPWWDVQAGIRQDLTGPERTHAVLGVQGLAPYLFEVDAAAFLSNEGDLTARVEAELDQRITQRLILQPRGEVNLSAQDVPERALGTGVTSAEVGVRLRYEFVREFAPYIGVEQEWQLGESADRTRLDGEDPHVTHYVIGVRFWF
ncbi:copper resistance protein B [Croceicoccus hydrothermalis]|uniref:copper resistance protein B n=1 Tax=Croceicoccus hydrothermalis TaxID=2867964 RepID=UPI001EFC20B0|nr:copper resistance protein B [Croceicoccus hydrothermalis]